MSQSGTTVRVVQNPDAKTQYIAIPSRVVQDSLYPFQEGYKLHLKIDAKAETAFLRRWNPKVDKE